MSTMTIHTPGLRAREPLIDPHMIDRSLDAAYARQRIEEFVRAILEDALSPAPFEAPPWRDDPLFEAELAEAISAITAATTDLVAETLAMLLETAPPRLAGRLAAAPRFIDRP